MTASQLHPITDARLPGLPVLLDLTSAADLLAASCADVVESVGIRNVRYKPGRRLVVQYDVCSGRETRLAAAVVDPQRDLRVLAAPPGLSWEEGAHALIQWYPVDVALPALAVTPEELAGKGPSELLGYKPLERAALRIGHRVVKLYRSRRKLERAAVALRTLARAGIPGGELLDVSETYSATVQAFIPGRTPGVLDAAGPAGALARRLHEVDPDGLEPVGAIRRLDAAARSGAVIAAILPPLRRRVSLLLGRLERSMPSFAEHVTAHGDFEPGQLVESDGLALVDLDDCCATARADDLAWYAAHAARGRNTDLDAVTEVVESLVEGYGSRPSGLAWYLSASLLARAPFPFRRQQADWPERVERLLSAAESARPRG